MKYGLCDKHACTLGTFETDAIKVPDCSLCRAERNRLQRQNTEATHAALRARFGIRKDATATDSYSTAFYELLKMIPLFSDGRNLSESTRRWMALHNWQLLYDGWKLKPVMGTIMWVEPRK